MSDAPQQTGPYVQDGVQIDPRIVQLIAGTRIDLERFAYEMGWEIIDGPFENNVHDLRSGDHLVSRFRAYARPRGSTMTER